MTEVEKVFSIGGSIVRENLDRIDELAEALSSGEQTVVVTGAGDLNRHQKAVSDLSNNGEQDLVGIKATRLNAQTLLTAMNAYPSVPETPEEVKKAARIGENVVMGGLTPGHSTDAVAAIVAELLEAELYIATTVDKVHTKHPEEEGAEPLDKVSPDELMEIVGHDYTPGSYELVDETAVKLIKRSRIPTKIFRGTIENIGNIGEAPGTEIEH